MGGDFILSFVVCLMQFNQDTETIKACLIFSCMLDLNWVEIETLGKK